MIRKVKKSKVRKAEVRYSFEEWQPTHGRWVRISSRTTKKAAVAQMDYNYLAYRHALADRAWRVVKETVLVCAQRNGATAKSNPIPWRDSVPAHE